MSAVTERTIIVRYDPKHTGEPDLLWDDDQRDNTGCGGTPIVVFGPGVDRIELTCLMKTLATSSVGSRQLEVTP